MMIRILLLTIGLSASAAMAQAPADQLYANVSRDLPRYVSDVDIDSLRRSQIAAIYSIMHGGANDGDKAQAIRSVIGGRFSLRAFLFPKNN